MYNDYYKKFESDLKEAQKFEVLISKYFKNKGFKIVEFCKNKFYDILIEKNDKQYKIEVKADHQTNTGNIIFEFFAFDKLSGISTSTSDFWIYVFPLINQIWIIKTKKLKELIKKYDPVINYEGVDNWTWAFGGDGKKTKVYIWKRDIFKKIIGDDLMIIPLNKIKN
jgi:hypothetical protein